MSRDTDDTDQPITIELLTVIEVEHGDLVHDTVSFDPDDIDAAFEELDARYLEGEAADHSHTWSLVKEAYAAFNRRELPPTTPDWVNIDHRRGTAFAPGDAISYVRAAWDVTPDINIYIEAVHRLSDLGAVVTQVSKGTSQQGFDAEWREIALLMFAGDSINRCEIFDEADLDAALDEVRRTQSAGAATRKRCHPGLERVSPMHSTAATWTVHLLSPLRTDDTKTAERACVIRVLRATSGKRCSTRPRVGSWRWSRSP